MTLTRSSSGFGNSLFDSNIYRLVMLVLSVYSILALAFIAIYKPDDEVSKLIQYSDWVVCIVFLLDFLKSFQCAPSRLKYFFTWGWLDLLSSIPVIDSLRAARFARVIRVLRGIRAIKSLSAIASNSRPQSAGIIVVAACFIFLFLGSTSVLIFEQQSNPSLTTAGQALWWAAVTMTTVGYGDTVPLTSEGRVVAVFLMVAGVGLFGALSGLIASWIIKPAEQAAVSSRDLAELKAEIAELKVMLSNQRKER